MVIGIKDTKPNQALQRIARNAAHGSVIAGLGYRRVGLSLSLNVRQKQTKQRPPPAQTRVAMPSFRAHPRRDRAFQCRHGHP